MINTSDTSQIDCKSTTFLIGTRQLFCVTLINATMSDNCDLHKRTLEVASTSSRIYSFSVNVRSHLNEKL